MKLHCVTRIFIEFNSITADLIQQFNLQVQSPADPGGGGGGGDTCPPSFKIIFFSCHLAVRAEALSTCMLIDSYSVCVFMIRADIDHQSFITRPIV